VVLLVLALFACATVASFYVGATTTADSNLTKVSSLGVEVTNLEQLNSVLQSQLTATTTNSNNSATSPSAVYGTYASSVVTIQGYEILTQNTFFGQVSSIESLQGSGFVVQYQNSSYVVTNNHVVDGVSNITVTFSDGNSYTASVKGVDRYRDLGVLAVSAPPSEFHPLQLLATSAGVTVGETVYAIGSPFGLSGSMTAGIVSQTGRTITESTNAQVTIPDVIQFSAAINPGNSGGPLLDSNGVVVGITTAAVSSSQGLGFAIPAWTLDRELPSLVSSGTYTLHPDLGIASSADMTYQLARAVGSNATYGVLVEGVTSGGAADKAGIRGGTKTVAVEGQNYLTGGDIIISVNGVKVVNSDALASYLEENAIAGGTVQLGIIRAGAYMTVNVVLAGL
jgi:S1-C subfamily serine protease